MAAQALPIGQASSRRFFPGETVVTCGVDALVQQGRLNPVPYAAYLQHGGVSVLSSSPERFATVESRQWWLVAEYA